MTPSPPCPNLYKVRKLAAGELPEAEAEQFEQHVLTCLACAEELNSLQASDPFLNDVRAASASSIISVKDLATDELIERLVRTPPEMREPTFRASTEARAVATRRILVAQARLEPGWDILALDKALTKLQAVDGESVRLVQLRHFARLTLAEAADILDISPAAADRLWAFAKAWLHSEIQGGSRSL
jgi:anti-sigma factor RsiW